MLAGFRNGSAGTDLTIYTITSAMRTAAQSREIAELAVRWRDARRRRLRHRRRRGRLSADAPPRRVPVRDARELPLDDPRRRGVRPARASGRRCSTAVPPGSGTASGSSTTSPAARARRSSAVWPRTSATAASRLELCPTSNVNTGVCASVAEHPIGMLRRLRFRVTVNTDNRLMSNTSMTNEMVKLADAFGWGLDDFEWLTINAMKSAFAPFPERLRIINGLIKPRVRVAARGALEQSDCRSRDPSQRHSEPSDACDVTLVDHPLVADSLARIRDRDTPNSLFRTEPRADRHAAARRGDTRPADWSRAPSRRRSPPRPPSGSACSRSSCRSCAPGSGSCTPPRS